MCTPAPDDLFEALLESTSDGVALVDPDGGIRSMNEAFQAFFSVTHDGNDPGFQGDGPGQLSPASWQDCFVADPPDLPELAAATEPVVRHLEDSTSIAEGADAIAGGYRVGIEAERVGDRYLVTVTDEQVAVERDQFRDILETVKDGIYMLNADGRIEYVNQAVLDAHDMSYDREQMVGEFATAILQPGDIEACIDAIQSLIRNDDEGSAKVSVTAEDLDGRGIPAELKLSLLPPEDGEFAGSVGVLRDVSERRRRDQMLRVLNRVLRHNLRNDMNVVAGLTELIESESADVDERYTQQIREVAAELVELGGKARVVEDFTGGDTSSTQSVDVVPIVDRIIEQTSANRSNGNVNLEMPAEAVASVPPMFETAVANVVENAFEHGDDPEILVSIEAQADAVCIVISDDGPGVPQAEIEALRSETETPLEHASGLGLWLTDWIIEFAGGEVSYDVDDGTTVTICLQTTDAHDR